MNIKGSRRRGVVEMTSPRLWPQAQAAESGCAPPDDQVRGWGVAVGCLAGRTSLGSRSSRPGGSVDPVAAAAWLGILPVEETGGLPAFAEKRQDVLWHHSHVVGGGSRFFWVSAQSCHRTGWMCPLDGVGAAQLGSWLLRHPEEAGPGAQGGQQDPDATRTGWASSSPARRSWAFRVTFLGRRFWGTWAAAVASGESSGRRGLGRACL